MKCRYHLTAAVFVVVLAACPNPAAPPVNNAPSATFPAVGYQVSGATSPAANGIYTSNGIFNGYLRYTQVSGTHVLFRFEATDDSLLHWGLALSEFSLGTLASAAYYSGTASTPPDSGWGGWALGTGSSGTPLVEKLPISGETEVGGTLTAHYDFQDPDGDAEGASTYQWYRFASYSATTGGTPVGTSSASYTTVAGDDGLWLRIEVTPVDEHGAAGTPVLSASVKVGIANTEPLATFPAPGYRVSGAGTAAANGDYAEDGTFGPPADPPPKYTQSAGSYTIFKFYNLSFSPRWGLHTTLPDPWSTLTDPSSMTYYYPTNTPLPPEGSWTIGTGTGPAAELLRIPISGSKAVGGTLTGHYTFTDTDGDAEGATVRQWYRFENASATTGGTAVGSDSASYTTVADDNAKWLRLQVTPIDEWGTAGTSVLSAPIQVGSS